MESTVERIQRICDIKHGLVASLKVAFLAISSTEWLLLHEQTPIVAGHSEFRNELLRNSANGVSFFSFCSLLILPPHLAKFLAGWRTLQRSDGRKLTTYHVKVQTTPSYNRKLSGTAVRKNCTLCHTYSVKEPVFFFNTSMRFLGSVVKRLSSKKLHSKKTTLFVLKKTLHFFPNCQCQ